MCMRRRHTPRMFIAMLLLAVSFWTSFSHSADAAPSMSASQISQSSRTLVVPLAAQLTDTAFSHLLDKSFDSLSGGVLTAAARAVYWAMSEFTREASPHVGAPFASGDWFATQYLMMMNIGFWVMIPMVILAVIHSVSVGSIQLLMRIFVMFLPMSIIGTAFATKILQLLLYVTDDISNWFLESAAVNLQIYATGFANGAITGTSNPLLDLIYAGLLLGVAVSMVVILTLREGTIYISTMLLPVGFAMMVWPVMARHLRKMVEFLIGIVMSKLIMVICIGFGIAAINGASGLDTAGLDVFTADNGYPAIETTENNSRNAEGEGAMSNFFTTMVPGLALMLMVVMTPAMALRLAGNIGLGETQNIVANAFGRDGLINQYIFFQRGRAGTQTAFGRPTLSTLEDDGSGGRRRVANDYSIAGRALALYREGKDLRRTSVEEQQLNAMGIFRNAEHRFGFTYDQLVAKGVDPDKADQLLATWDDRNVGSATLVAAGFAGAYAGANFEGIERTSDGVIVRKRDGSATVIGDFDRRAMLGANPVSRAARYLTTEGVTRLVYDEAKNQQSQFGEVRGIQYVMPVRERQRAGHPQNRHAFNNREARLAGVAYEGVRRAQNALGDVPGAANISVHTRGSVARGGLGGRERDKSMGIDLESRASGYRAPRRWLGGPRRAPYYTRTD